MAWPGAELFEILLKNLTDRIALAVFFIALIFIAFAKLLPADSSFGQWSQAHLITWYVMAIAALCYLPTRYIIEGVDGYVSNRGKHNNLRKHLKSLGSDDREVLCGPIQTRAMSFSIGSLRYHVAKSLEKRGIVFETEHKGAGVGSFTIDKAAFDYLTEHPELVKPITKQEP